MGPVPLQRSFESCGDCAPPPRERREIAPGLQAEGRDAGAFLETKDVGGGAGGEGGGGGGAPCGKNL